MTESKKLSRRATPPQACSGIDGVYEKESLKMVICSAALPKNPAT